MRQPEPNIVFKQIDTLEDRSRAGFVAAYKAAFSGPPYFEEYEDQWIVENVWEHHLANGCVFVALHDGQVVGLACAHVASDDTEPKVRDFLNSCATLPFLPDQTRFMSELAVIPSFEHRGIGTQLIEARLEWARRNGMVYYALRTAEEGSNSLPIYLRRGAKIADGVVQYVGDGEIETKSNRRIYLWDKL